MTVNKILTDLIHTDLPRSLSIFLPELILCGTIVLFLLVRLFGADRKLPPYATAMLGALLAFGAAFAQFLFLQTGGNAPAPFQKIFEFCCINASGVGQTGAYFTGLLVHDLFGLMFRIGLILFLLLMISLTTLTGIPDDEDGPEFYTLLFGSTIGMLLACSANNLLMLFLAVEMMSLPSYVLVGFLKGRKQSSEAALKYVVYGAGAAGVMLYGVSLIAGITGTLNLPQIAERLSVVIGSGPFTLSDPNCVVTVLGLMLVLVGLAFKLSLVPFHFWCPDAFQGAAAEVAGFLSIASKAAAFALLVRFVLAFQGPTVALKDLSLGLGLALGVMGAVSATFGNLAAYTQTNLKRLLAYSTIAHAGYMLMAPAAMLVLLSSNQPDHVEQAARALEGLIYYLAVYLFMNLTAFTIVAAFRNELFSEELQDYRGLYEQEGTTRFLCLCLGVSFFSLVGMPPFGGFFAKLLIFAAVFKAGTVHWLMWAILAAGGLNTVFSLWYYVKVLKTIFISPRAEQARPLQTPVVIGVYVALVAVPILLLGASTLQENLTLTARHVAASLFKN